MRARRGDAAGLRALLAKLEGRARSGYVSPMAFAALLAALGERDQAFARLEEAFRTGAPALSEIAFAWEYDPLRSDPRLADLLKRVGLR